MLQSSRSFWLTLKDIVLPIERSELKLFIPLALLLFCILFNFGALRSLKDGLIVPSIGAEVISFLKLWFVLPFSLIFTIFYVKLSNNLSAEKIFYVIVSAFLIFFLIFAYLIYPNLEQYHFSEVKIEYYANKHITFQWFIKILGKWSFALLYIFCELWSVVVINLMFWQFTNNIFDVKAARRFYPALGMIGNSGLIAAGYMLISFTSNATLASAITSEVILQIIITIIAALGFLAMILFKWLNITLVKHNELISKGLSLTNTSVKTELTVKESFKLIMSSNYIRHIVVLLICYGLLINILEGPWKASIRKVYPDTLNYINFMGKFNIWMGIFSVLFMLVGSNILRRVSWLKAAQLTPIMMSITGILFFAFLLFADNQDLALLYPAVIIGAVQNILSKSTKYSLFDATKEMAYIPLPLELKVKGKATVEILGAKLGKSSGAFIQSAIFMFMPLSSFESITIYLLIMFIFVVMIWFWNITKLNKLYLSATNE